MMSAVGLSALAGMAVASCSSEESEPSTDCAGSDARTCTSIAACLCGASTCEEICALSASTRKQCISYAAGFPFVFEVSASDCGACSAVAPRIDPTACSAIESCLAVFGRCKDAGGSDDACFAWRRPRTTAAFRSRLAYRQSA
jgi:hypothetical protein